MAQEYSFDVVSQFDFQELVNAVDQASREIRTRFDLKGSGSKIELSKNELLLVAANDFQLRSVRDLLQSKAVRRGLSLKIFDFDSVQPASGGKVKQPVRLRQGLSSERLRAISKLIRDNIPKVRPAIQGDALRVFGKNKDDLQRVISLLKEQDYPEALQFINYR